MWFKNILKDRFSSYNWVRKYIGGYWECWYIDCIHTDLWFNITSDKIETFRPCCGFGTPYCEYYPMNFFGSKLEYSKELYKSIIREEKLKRILY